ncbi:predicted protein [Thalassiosira pseudonana CCMP1335]|uniref:GST N-terminal domain-containing protein n=1 Tax=Thalassiosira pseudonana TaxID=35128 RepID=B5YMK0_THAPS|nr:predicted protein [Thalassiosira pseudonana CCMP1335]ACI64821.1 predicted protein [Thalassiosira pseudonana CCMP1335]
MSILNPIYSRRIIRHVCSLQTNAHPTPSSTSTLARVIAHPSPAQSWGILSSSFSRSFATSDVLALSSQPNIKLFQYHICPFCNITKSLFSYSNLDYDVVEVNPLTKAELKPWSGDYKKVPIAKIDDEQINGSEEILQTTLNSPFVQQYLEQRWESDDNDNDSKMTIQQFQKSESAQRWFRFAADDLAALLYPNICGNLSDSYNAFAYVKDVDSFSGMQKISIQTLGALAMYFAASKVKSKRNVTDEKAALQSALDTFEKEGLQSGTLTFSSGNKHTPDMGDLAVFGVLYSVRGMNAHTTAIQCRGGAVKEWYDRMHALVVGKKADHAIKLGVSCK